METWIVKIEYMRTSTLMTELEQAAEKIDLTITEIERAAGKIVQIRHGIPAGSAIEALAMAADMLTKLKGILGERIEPRAVVVHPTDAAEPFPEVRTISDIAHDLGVTRQRAQQLSRHPDFPRPVAKTANGPLYSAVDIALVRDKRKEKGRK